MRHFTLVLLAALLAFTSCGKSSQQKEEEIPSEVVLPEPTIEYGIVVDSLHAITGKVKSGQVMSTLLRDLGADSKHTSKLHLIDPEDFDMRRLRAGKSYVAYYSNDSIDSLRYLVYLESLIDYTVFHFEDSIHVEKGHRPTRLERKTSRAVIESSLWNAIAGQDLNFLLALELSDMYAWTIDFFGLQKNDAFTVYYDEEYVDSTSVGIHQIYAANFRHMGQDTYAYYFANDSVEGFWDENGHSLKKAFLKAPLSYSRISSGFTYARKHPIFKTVRPHTGVDYAAPMGTPVMSIGDGVVIAKGYMGGGGHTVKIKHNSVYTSAYLHLSRYGKINVGSRVKQGDIIGYVGSTGHSTGPHLDFRIWKNGTPVNPLKMESPPVAPIPDIYRAEFDSIKAVMQEKLMIKGKEL